MNVTVVIFWGSRLSGQNFKLHITTKTHFIPSAFRLLCPSTCRHPKNKFKKNQDELLKHEPDERLSFLARPHLRLYVT